MAITKVITDRQATKLTSLVRRGESPPPPRVNQVMRSTNVHRQGNYHPPMAVVATCDSSIGPNGGSGFCTVQQGPHPLTASTERYRAYNYATTALEASSYVMLSWIRATGTNGFWLAVPLCCGEGAVVVGCGYTTEQLSVPLSIRIQGVASTSNLTSSVPALLNLIHDLDQGEPLSCVRNTPPTADYYDLQGDLWTISAAATPSGWEVTVSYFYGSVTYVSNGRAAPFNPTTQDILVVQDGTMSFMNWTNAIITVNP